MLTASHSGYSTVPKDNYSSFVLTCKIKMAFQTFWWHLLTSFDVPETAGTLALTKARYHIAKQFCHTVVVCLTSKYNVLSEFHMFQVFLILGDQQQCICVLPAKLNCGTIQFFFFLNVSTQWHITILHLNIFYLQSGETEWLGMYEIEAPERLKRMKRGTYMSEVFYLCLTVLWRKIENNE